MRCPSTTRLDEIHPSIFMYMPVLLRWLVCSLLIPSPPVDPAAARGRSIAIARSRSRPSPTMSIKPATSFCLARRPPRVLHRVCSQVFMNLYVMIRNMSAIPTQNLERGLLGWKPQVGEVRVTWVIGEGGWRGATRLRLGERATTARWAARWRGGCEARRVRRQRCGGSAAETTRCGSDGARGLDGAHQSKRCGAGGGGRWRRRAVAAARAQISLFSTAFLLFSSSPA
jgi:hypothetical protein